jgi:hypothetical protein
MKKKITSVIIFLITIVLLYIIWKQYHTINPTSPPSTTISTSQSHTKPLKPSPITSPPKNSSSGHTNNEPQKGKYKKLITNYQNRLGPNSKITIRELNHNKSIKFHDKNIQVIEAIITTTTAKFGTNSFQAYIDPKTQTIIQQWNFKREDGLFIKHNRPEPLHPSGEIKR